MKYYRITDTRDRHISDLHEYTFTEVKNYFEPCDDLKEDDPELYEKWKSIQDLYDLMEFLRNDYYEGMLQPYEIEYVGEKSYYRTPEDWRRAEEIYFEE